MANKLVIKQNGNSIPVESSEGAYAIYDQNSQSFKKIWVGTIEEYCGITPSDDTIYIVQQN